MLLPFRSAIGLVLYIIYLSCLSRSFMETPFKEIYNKKEKTKLTWTPKL